MNCPACEAENREGARFCRSCGLRLLTDDGLPAQTLSLEAEDAAAAQGRPGRAARTEAVAEEMLAEETPTEEEGPVGAPLQQAPPGDEISAEAAVADGGPGLLAAEPVPGDAEPEAGPKDVPGPGPDLGTETGIEQEEGVVEGMLEEVGAEVEEEIPAETILAEASTGLEAEEETTVAEEAEFPAGSKDDVLAFWREEAELMTPLSPDTVIEGRYAVVEALDVQENQILYYAQDLQRCWQCGSEDNDPEGAFCTRCGVLMDRRPEVRLLEVLDPETEPPTGKTVAARFSHESRHLLLLTEPEPGPEPEAEALPEPLGVHLLAGQRSDAGQLRELDEDSLFVLTLSPTYEAHTGPVLGLYIVADGMGGHAGGEVASKMAVQAVVDHVMRSVILPELAGELVLQDDILPLLRQATMAANDAVYLARQKRETDMGTTLTTALIRDDHLFVAHVGDCRAYRWNEKGLEQLTTDHSVIATMIAHGQARPEELYTHPHRSIVYRCIGDKPLVDVDSDMLPIAPGDRIIVCSDGLWEMVRDEGIDDVMMQEADPQSACDLLVRHANAAGGEDNISVIVVQVDVIEELGNS